jgi:hypothetical protein
MASIYLCHKCGGHLTENHDNASAYACGCMSGWIRDWQKPTAPENVKTEQLIHATATLEHYLWQKRSEKDTLVVMARALVARLSN